MCDTDTEFLTDLYKHPASLVGRPQYVARALLGSEGHVYLATPRSELIEVELEEDGRVVAAVQMLQMLRVDDGGGRHARAE